MDFESIRVFLTVVDTGSISAASKLLFTSQSSISRRITALERDVKCELMIREKGRSSVSLTTAGEAFLKTARQMEILHKDIETLSQAPERKFLSVGAHEAATAFILISFYRQFVEEHPDICLSTHLYHTTDIYTRISNHFIDVGYVGFQVDYPDIICRPLLQFPFVLVTRKDSPYHANMNIEDLPAEKELYIQYNTQYELWHNHIFPGKRYLLRSSNVMMLSEYLQIKDSWALCYEEAAKILQKNLDFTLAVYPVQNVPISLQIYEISNIHTRESRVEAMEIFQSELREYMKKKGLQ